MNKLIISLFILSVNFLIAQQKEDMRDIFELQCWKKNIKELENMNVVIAIQNSFDNWSNKCWARKPIIIYYRDSLFNWYYKIVLPDVEKRIWRESESFSVKLFFSKYLNNNLDEVKTEFKKLNDDESRKQQAGFGSMKFYYIDSSDKIRIDFYSSSFGINELFLSNPIIFNIYSYAINMSFNIKFNIEYKIKEYYYPLKKEK